MDGVSGVSNQRLNSDCRKTAFPHDQLRCNVRLFDPQLHKPTITQHVVYITCGQGEKKSLIESVVEKTVNFVGRTLIGALTSGAVLTACRLWADSGLASGLASGVFVNNQAMKDILVASAGLGVSVGMASSSAGNAAILGLEFGGVASATYALANGQQGALSGKFDNGLQYLNDKTVEMKSSFATFIKESVLNRLFGP